MTYLTEERLKSYLDTNQLRREQMCQAVLGIDRRFSEVRPRHPRGGPDGGRDLQAKFQSSQLAFGAVGFVNTANDSREHKRRVKAKFKDDLGEAMKADPKPEVFVFFTNVNLTTGEKDGLIGSAAAAGMAYCDIYDRERIRIALDGADGLAARFQYLQIPLSEAEQATFFARWGEDIQGLIGDRFDRVEALLHRIQWLHESAEIMTVLAVYLELDKEYDGAEIGHFRAFCHLSLREPKHDIFSILFGNADDVSRYWTGGEGRAGIQNGYSGGQWEQRLPLAKFQDGPDEAEEPDEEDSSIEELIDKWTEAGMHTSAGVERVRLIRIGYSQDDFIRLQPRLTVKDFDDCMFLFLLNRSLAERVKAIHVYGNEYKLLEVGEGEFHIDEMAFEPNIPGRFSDEELSDSWVRLRPNRSSAFTFRFSEATPRRFLTARETKDSLARG